MCVCVCVCVCAQKTIAECQHILQDNIRNIDEWCNKTGH